MYRNKAIVNYTIRNDLWDKFWYGTELQLRLLKISDAIEGQEIFHINLTHCFTSRGIRDSGVSLKSYDKEFKFERLSEQYPDIVKLKRVLDFCLIDKKSNYFQESLSINLGRFCKDRDEFLSNPNNGTVILPADQINQFINSVLDYADNQPKHIFAVGALARFAKETAMKLQKIK